MNAQAMKVFAKATQGTLRAEEFDALSLADQIEVCRQLEQHYGAWLERQEARLQSLSDEMKSLRNRLQTIRALLKTIKDRRVKAERKLRRRGTTA